MPAWLQAERHSLKKKKHGLLVSSGALTGSSGSCGPCASSNVRSSRTSLHKLSTLALDWNQQCIHQWSMHLSLPGNLVSLQAPATKGRHYFAPDVNGSANKQQYYVRRVHFQSASARSPIRVLPCEMITTPINSKQRNNLILSHLMNKIVLICRIPSLFILQVPL